MNIAEIRQKPIRVLHVFARLNRGGAETMVVNLHRVMDPERVQFDYVVNESDTEYAYTKEVRDLGGRVFQLPRYTIINTPKYRRAWEELLTSHPEWSIVHGHHLAPASVYIPIAKRLGRVTIAHGHNAYVKENPIKLLVRKMGLRSIRRTADHLFACSNVAGQWMFGSRASFLVVKNAINIDNFAFDIAARQRIRREFGIGDVLLIGHVGSFTHQKNHRFILRVFCEVRNRIPEAKLLLVGDGDLLGKTEKLAERLGIREQVIFAGVRTDVPALLSAMDAFLFPSLHEGLPLTLIEAQTSGLPVVASDAISSEVCVSELIEFIPLQNGASFWANVVEQAAAKTNLPNRKASSSDTAYDINANAGWLMDFYLSAQNN